MAGFGPRSPPFVWFVSLTPNYRTCLICTIKDWAWADTRRFPVDVFDNRWIPPRFSCGFVGHLLRKRSHSSWRGNPLQEPIVTASTNLNLLLKTRCLFLVETYKNFASFRKLGYGVPHKPFHKKLYFAHSFWTGPEQLRKWVRNRKKIQKEWVLLTIWDGNFIFFSENRAWPGSLVSYRKIGLHDAFFSRIRNKVQLWTNTFGPL